MRISEIQRQRGDKGSVDFSQEKISAAERKTIKPVPGNKQYGYTFSSYQSPFTGSSKAIYLFDIKNPQKIQAVGYLAVRPTPFPLPRAVMVANVVLDSNYRGQGLGQLLYIIATKILGLTVVADESQTPEAIRLWTNLHRIPGVEVSGYVSIYSSDWQAYPDVDDPDAARLIRLLKKGDAEVLGRKGGRITISVPVSGAGKSQELKSLIQGIQIYSAKHPEEGGTDNGLYARWVG